MLLLDEEQPDLERWLADRKLILTEFAEKIDGCIKNLEWEKLTAVLNDRQQYIQHLYQESLPAAFHAAIKELILSILQQDEVFQTRIQRQKYLASQQQIEIERGRRAIDAYTSQ